MTRVARTRTRYKGTGVYAGDDLSPAYRAASHGGTRKHWRAPEVGPNQALQFNLTHIRNRSRDQVRQNAYAARASDAFVSNLVGTGIRPLPKVDDEALNARLRARWADWVEQADATGVLDFYGLQAQIVRAWFEGGECFIRKRLRQRRDGLVVPLQLQVLESEHVPIEKNEIEPTTGNVIRHGIEFDAIGRRVAYHMYRTHPGDRDGLEILTQRDPNVPGMTSRVPADEVLHVFLPTRPGQQRGEPQLTQALLTLRDLDQFNEAELQRQKAGRMFVGAIRRVSDEGPALAEEDEDATAEADDAVDVQTLEPLTMTQLDPGEDIQWSSPPEVGDTYEAFLRHHLRAVAQSCGVLYEQLTGDYNQINDRTFRAAFNGLHRQVEALQQSIVIPQLCRPTWRWFFDTAETAGRLRVPQTVDAREARRVEWIPHAHRHIHPLQDVQADRARVRAGFKSRSAVLLDQGHDPEDVDRQIAADKRRGEQLELMFDSEPWNTSQAGGAQQPAEDDGESAGGQG